MHSFPISKDSRYRRLCMNVDAKCVYRFAGSSRPCPEVAEVLLKDVNDLNEVAWI